MPKSLATCLVALAAARGEAEMWRDQSPLDPRGQKPLMTQRQADTAFAPSASSSENGMPRAGVNTRPYVDKGRVTPDRENLQTLVAPDVGTDPGVAAS